MSGTSVTNEATPHLGGYISGGDEATYFPELWDWLVETYSVKSVVDVGCGEGHALNYFKGKGLEVLGIDGMPIGIEGIVQHDYSTGEFDVSPGAFDLVWSCEFVEHVDEQCLSNMRTSFCSAPVIAMTHAFPGQGGHHHVNCRNSEYWIGVMASWGYRFDAQATQKAKSMAAHNINPYNHFVRSGMIFVKS